MKEIIKSNNSMFEEIKHIDDNGNEYWLARELQKAIISCENSNQSVDDHFVQVDVMVSIGSNTKRELNDYKLSRYACYLIVQNADSRKEFGLYAKIIHNVPHNLDLCGTL